MKHFKGTIVKKIFAFFALCFIALCAVSAQSADIIGDIIKEEKTTWKSLTYLAYYSDDDNVDKTISLTDAFDYFSNAGIIPSGVTPDTLLRYDDMSLFLLKAFDIKATSILYYCFHSRHYAFRQMKYYGVIKPDAFPGDKMTGSFFVTIMGKFSSTFPNAKLIYKGAY